MTSKGVKSDFTPPPPPKKTNKKNSIFFYFGGGFEGFSHIDSTVNNGVTTEDDYGSATFVVQSGRAPGNAPVLSCPAGSSIFDWDAIPGWTAGSVDNTYAFATYGNVRFQLTNNGAYINSATFGGASPNVFTYFNGGLNPLENTLQVVSDQTNQSGVVTITMTLPRSFTDDPAR